MPVLVENDAHRAQIIMGDLPAGSQVVADAMAVEHYLDNRPDEYAVVVGPEVELREATDLADRLRRTHPSVSVAVMRFDLSAQVFAEAMRAGIRAVVPAEDRSGLTDAVSRLRESWEAMHGPIHGGADDGRVITIFSPKGGVGKTTVAVNLAEALLDGGRKNVCLVDLDLAFGDVAITLQLVPQHTIDETVGFEDHLDFNLLDSLLTRHDNGLAIMAAPTSPDGKDRITVSLVRAVLRTLRSHFDYVVIDTAPGFEDHVLAAFDETDDCILIATLDVPTVKNVKVAIDTLDMLSLAKESRHLVLNRADDQVGLTAENVEGILHMPVEVALPSSLAVATATNQGQPIVLAKPDHPVSRAFFHLARTLTVESAPEGKGASRAAADSADKRGGLFGRRKKAGNRRMDAS
ncbi:MAG TPA: P-loop NTPase [Marmoricola sp.]|nr:P-loop NTPase [Marmoricola sp.]